MKTLGILGGMGPYASIEFYKAIIEKSKHVHKKKLNSDFPHLLISNLPVPDLVTNDKQKDQCIQMLITESQKLEKAGADFLVIACNTMHVYLDQYKAKVNIPFVSIIEAVIEQVKSDNKSKIAVLGTSSMINSKLYQNKLQEYQIEPYTLSKAKQQILNKVILKTIAGKQSQRDIETVQSLILNCKEKGVEGIILGCTELPLLINQTNSALPIYSSLDILATKACREIYQ